ncbi:hypothetical protein L3Y34_004496 [Caenorhabditis briggsae]|uniref:Uncharacterized protein n=1 Tax=Caenorhabditis briggsae TaxID=6238 RepID=A0AAE9ABS7_CAEBR|nr:hypothetical protein L3Y34_004496 [Caenorhabditis briggsae]
MFLNHRPVLVFLLFLAASPVDVVSRVLYSDSIYQDGYPVNETLRLDPLQLDLNPLHLLCPVCSIMQDVLGLVTGLVLGGGLLKHVGITVCSIGLSSTIKIPILPNALCAAIFELIFMLTKKVGGGICPLFALCPMPKQKAKPTKSSILATEEEYENQIFDIIGNKDSTNLSPQMEYIYQEFLKQLPLEEMKHIRVKDDDVRNILRNFVAALQFHLDHRKEYLAITSLNV